MNDIEIMDPFFERIPTARREEPEGGCIDDEEIVRLLNARDERALNEISQKYRSMCMSVSKNILQNHEDSMECVNDTFLKAWESIPPAKPKSLPAHLTKIARNTARFWMLSINFCTRPTRADERYSCGGTGCARAFPSLRSIL